MPFTQDYRDLAIATSLGEDKVLLRRASITEQLGRPFRIEAELSSEDGNLDFSQIVGQDATIRLELLNSRTPRFFNGIVSRFTQLGVDPQYGVRYRATLVPWLWLLTRTADCRIFQHATVPDIVKQVFRDHGFKDFDDRLTQTYTSWEYCVQYRETDFNFVSRLMEQEGIYYFFEHANGKHTLVFADSASVHQPFPGYEEIPFLSAQAAGGREGISSWVLDQEIQPGGYTLNDFNFELPGSSLVAKSIQARSHQQSQFELYDYPGEYAEQGDGTDYSKVRVEELQAQFETVHGHGEARGLAAGCRFTLTDAERRDQNRAYLVTGAFHELTNNHYTTGQAGSDRLYACNFTALSLDQPFRTARTTPKPLIQGPQTAIVVGRQGEEIDPDKYGRVKVQFHWDRHGEANDKSSCWVRVSQPTSAGKKWGAMSIPRVGQEVIVEFLEGDPDSPIITGQVYNSNTMPPYELPLHKTRTTIKTNSTGNGGGFNELRFEDKKGAEQVFIHAERNQDVRVKSDSLEYVGHDRHLVVEHDQFETVSGDKHQEVKGESNQKVGETFSISVGQNIQEKAGQNIATEAGAEIHVKAGMNLVLEAGASLTLKAGAGFVVVNAAGVTISGPLVLINSGGSPGSGAGCSPTPPQAAKAADTATGGSQTQPTAAAPAQIKPTSISSTAVKLRQASDDGAAFMETSEPSDGARLLAILKEDPVKRAMDESGTPGPSPTGESVSAWHPSGDEEDPEQPHDPEEERRQEERLDKANREMEEFQEDTEAE